MSTSPTLLVSLGKSAVIVPEAFLLPGTDVRAVHVITTETTNVRLVEGWFADRAPGVLLSATRVEDFRDFTSE